MAALDGGQLVVALTRFDSPSLRQVADVMLPIAPFTETSGTFVNCEGRAQSFTAVAKPFGDVRPGWKVLRVLGNLLALAGFDSTPTPRPCVPRRSRVISPAGWTMAWKVSWSLRLPVRQACSSV
jgi:anaerobic selenocysteine-containing dehydrogenase